MKLSRRNFLKLAGAAGAGALLGLKPLPASAPTLSQAPARATLRLLGLTRSISAKAFTQAAASTGLAVQISNAQDSKAVVEGMDGCDLVITPAHALTDLIRRGLVREFAPIPVPALPQRAYDPLNAFSLPVGRGAIGILSRGVTPPLSWAEFFTLARTEPTYLPPAESFRAALKSLGYSINTRDAAARAQAKSLISNLPSISFSEARLAIGPMLPDKSEWSFNLPAEGAELWEDCFCIPAASPHPDLAQAFIQAAIAAEPLTHLPASAWPLEPLSPFAPV